jgi:hypothetical protein
MAEGKSSSVLKWILIGCGGIVLIGLLVMGGCVWFVKGKVDNAKQSVNKAMKDTTAEARGPVVALSVMKPFMGMMLAAADKPAMDRMYADLDAKASKLTSQDGMDLKAAMDSYNDSNRNAGTDQAARQAAARKLISDTQAVLDRH